MMCSSFRKECSVPKRNRRDPLKKQHNLTSHWRMLTEFILYNRPLRGIVVFLLKAFMFNSKSISGITIDSCLNII